MIRWLKIMETITELYKIRVDITLSTFIDKYIKGMAVQQEDKNYIFLNAFYHETEEDILKTIFHELAHILLNSKKHNDTFDKKVKKIEKEFMELWSKNEIEEKTNERD